MCIKAAERMQMDCKATAAELHFDGTKNAIAMAFSTWNVCGASYARVPLRSGKRQHEFV